MRQVEAYTMVIGSYVRVVTADRLLQKKEITEI